MRRKFFSDDLYFRGYQDKWCKFNYLIHPRYKFKTDRLLDYLNSYKLKECVELGKKNVLVETDNFLVSTHITNENRYIRMTK